jgi:Protein of unknown function (DUF4232)
VIKGFLLLLLLALAHGCGTRRAATPPLCRDSQLRVTQGRTAVGLGNRLEELVFTNVGGEPCLLRGYPIAITGETAAGRRVVQALRGGTYFGRLVPAVLPPGGRGFLDFGTADWTDCGGRARVIARYTDLVFTLPQGRKVRAPHVSITEHCSLSISELGRPEAPR